MAVVCWFFFYHHPAHIDINIRKSQGNVANFGFNVDNTKSIFRASGPKPVSAAVTSSRDFSNPVSDEPVQLSNNAEVGSNSITQKLDVTLIDAFRIRDLNLLILSYVFREAHDAFLKQTDSRLIPDTSEEARLTQESYSIGAVVGICFAGVIADLFLKKKRFLIILVLNTILLCWDFYLFFRP